MRKNKLQHFSYFLVQQALKSASVSPFPPPPTVSSAARLQSVTRKQSVSKQCFHLDLDLQPTATTQNTISTCACTVHLHSCIPHVFLICNMGPFSLFRLMSSRLFMQKTVWISFDFTRNAKNKMLCKTSRGG